MLQSQFTVHPVFDWTDVHAFDSKYAKCVVSSKSRNGSRAIYKNGHIAMKFEYIGGVNYAIFSF